MKYQWDEVWKTAEKEYTKPINNQADFDRLTAIGANPLEVMLGTRLTSAN